MSKIDDGGPAFPRTIHEMELDVPGMTLRDWFAGRALPYLQDAVKFGVKSGAFPIEEVAAIVADAAYQQADAMIAARAKGGAA